MADASKCRLLIEKNMKPQMESPPLASERYSPNINYGEVWMTDGAFSVRSGGKRAALFGSRLVFEGETLFDFPAQRALNDLWHIFGEPVFEHRPQ